MGAIKQAWITEHDSSLVALSIESEHVNEVFRRVRAVGLVFPEVPSKNNPLRHTISINLLDEEDLKKILIAICKHLKYNVEL